MRPFAPAALAGALALAAGPLFAEPLPTGDAAALGFSPEALQALDARIQMEIDAGEMPGAAIMIVRDGRIAHMTTMGKLTPDGDALSEDAIYRIYSMSKPITSVAALMLVERGELDIGAPVSQYIPEFKDMKVATGKNADGTVATEPAKGAMTVQDLMRHTSGLTYGFFGSGPARDAYKEAGVGSKDLDNMATARQLAGLPLEHQPGTTWEYSRATDVLGAVIEVVSGQKLGEFLQTNVFEPLKMEDTSFFLTDQSKHDRIAEAYPEDAKIGQFDMFDPREEAAFESGGGGLVSTLHDYSRFATMLMNGGELDGTRILSPETVAWMTSDHLGEKIEPGKYYLPGEGYGFGLGVAVRADRGVSSVNGVAGEYNWGGAAGTYWWNDPVNDMSVVYMMQSPPARVKMRWILKNMVYGAMTGETAQD